MIKMGSDKFLSDFRLSLHEDYISILKWINSVKEKIENSNVSKEVQKLGSMIIKTVEMIKDSDLFKVVQINSLQREIKELKEDDEDITIYKSK